MNLSFSAFVCAAAMLFSGCASVDKTVAGCDEQSVCPVVIYKKTFGGFDVYPKKIVLTSGAKKMSILWTFAEQDKYEFIGEDFTNSDGVVFAGSRRGSKEDLDINLCYLSDKTKLEGTYRLRSPYYQCDFNVRMTEGVSIPYTIKFHGKNNGPAYSLDPEVDTSGPGIMSLAIGTPDVPRPWSVEVGKSSAVPLPLDKTVAVVWNALASSGKFDSASAGSVRLFQDPEMRLPFISLACRLSDKDGLELPSTVTESEYFSCIFPGTSNFIFYYRAQYTAAKGAVEACGVIQRPTLTVSGYKCP